jgi:hypothetical protein
MRLDWRLRTAAITGLLFIPPGECEWRAVVVMMMMMMMVMRAGDNSWLVHQSSLAILPAETSGAIRRNGRRSENFAYQYLKYVKGPLICRKILRHGTSGFTSHPKEVVLRIFIALLASGVFESANLGFSNKHTNHYTTEATLTLES